MYLKWKFNLARKEPSQSQRLWVHNCCWKFDGTVHVIPNTEIIGSWFPFRLSTKMGREPRLTHFRKKVIRGVSFDANAEKSDQRNEGSRWKYQIVGGSCWIYEQLHSRASCWLWQTTSRNTHICLAAHFNAYGKLAVLNALLSFNVFTLEGSTI